MSNTTNPLTTPGATSMESYPTGNRHSLIFGVTSACIAVTTLFMAIRVYIRGHLMRAWKLDDTIFICSSCSSNLGAIYGALGLHIWMVPLSLMKTDAHYQVSNALAYQISFAFVKATFLLQYRRAFALPNIKLFCDTFLGILFIISSAMLISGGLTMRNLLDPNTIPNAGEKQIVIFIYVNAAAHLLTDIIIFIMPIALVGQLRLAKMQKIGLITSFGVGIFTSAISILRIISVQSGLGTTDPYYGAVPLALLGIAEPTSAIICACIPFMRPLLSCSGTSKYGSHGSRRNLSRGADDSAGRMHLRHNLSPQLPTSPTDPTTPEMTRTNDDGKSINGDIEGYHTSQQARCSINSMNPLTMHPSALTRT
ncbi:integral membrane protein [Colletotrichum tofieldiae]|uniref:Integral membrane protein n=1 Tax=Colletotrichum tofieldiae TaxID=708197 RepID=A0A166RX56_9PEZI|nr:integral membrane protein [Colletotrichum tofieldiae]